MPVDLSIDNVPEELADRLPAIRHRPPQHVVRPTDGRPEPGHRPVEALDELDLTNPRGECLDRGLFKLMGLVDDHMLGCFKAAGSRG